MKHRIGYLALALYRSSSALLLSFVPLVAQEASRSPLADPALGEVPRSCAEGWYARHVFDAGAGVWTVAAAQVHPQFGCPEILAMDDLGRLTVLRSYSGKWTPELTITDGKWFAPVACGDLDPGQDGLEIYTGGAGGRLWEIHPRPTAHFDARVIAEWPGEEIHTLMLGDLDRTSAGQELLVFLMSGRVASVSYDASGATHATVRDLEPLPGRVRQGFTLPGEGRESPGIVTVSRTGELGLVRLHASKLERSVLAKEPMGLGRVDGVVRDDGKMVLYVTRDDGIVLRFAGRPGQGTLEREVIYVGHQGPRGLVAGRFHEDPARECVVIFGYSTEVEFLSRIPGGAWQAETIFTEVDKGHWLAKGEFDGRNGTEEIIGSGYAGRVFLLGRPPGYGLAKGPAVVGGTEEARRRKDVVRIGLRARAGSATQLTPLSYTGGFEPKTMIYETLVRAGVDGRVVPGLAESWKVEGDGCGVSFRLREGARFHDGTPVTAEDVRQHFRRWIGFPEHDWLPSNRRIVNVVAVDERTLKVEMDRPWALLPDLCAINPCAIQGPGSRNREGVFMTPVGTGPYRFVEAYDDGSRWLVERWEHGAGTGRFVEVRVFPRGGNVEPLDAIQRGEIDAFVGGWDEYLPAERLDALRSDENLRLIAAPGSAVVSLRFSFDGPTSAVSVRRAIAHAVSRREIIQRVEGGYADPCTRWAAPGVTWWPAPRTEDASNHVEDARAPAITLRVAAGRGERTRNAARIVVDQLGRAGFTAELVEGRDADVTVSISFGVPYDPHSTLMGSFGPSSPRAASLPAELRDLIQRVNSQPGFEERLPMYALIQEILDREVLLVPLYVPHRIGVHAKAVEGLQLDIDVYSVGLESLRFTAR